MALSYWWSMIPCVYLARIRRYGASKIFGSRVWPFGLTWRHLSRDFLLVVHCNHAFNLHHNGVTSLTFWGHVTSSVTWPFDSAYVVSYLRSIVTMRLACTATEIWGLKDNGVTSLTFWGQVTSSVTLPFDSAYVVSYWWFIVTMRLSCTVREI